MNEPLGERALQRLLALAAGDTPAEAPALPPRYRLLRELGRGGMGVVYEAFDEALGRRCAVKTLGPGADDALRARFVREATAAARLRHPHIASVYDATPAFLAMQLIAGGPIGCTPALPPERAVALLRDAARALQHAHEHGIVHRDVKPSNLLVEGDHVYLVDFGLARTFDAASSWSFEGAVLGTPAFMPPEQALGRHDAVDARSDVYGLGATLHWCLTGAPPFAAADLPTLLRQVVDDEPRATGVDRDLDVVLAKCLAKDPARRYASAGELAADLERWLRHEPVQARRPSFGYRLKKRLQRQRTLWRAAALAVAATALVLVPMWWSAHAARDAATTAVQLADHTSAVLQDAALASAMGDWSSAQRRLLDGTAPLRDFLARHDVPRVRYLLARLLRAANRPDEALAELARALDGEPTLADARFERGLLLAAKPGLTAAERAQAIDDLGLADTTATARPLSVLRDVDRLFGRAERLRLQGEAGRAMDLLREVLAYDGLHVPARLSLAAAARDVGDDALAVYYAASAVDLQQGFGPFYLGRERSTLPTSMHGLPGALVDFSLALREAPDHGLALAQRGLVHLRRALRAADEDRLADAMTAVRDAVADHDALVALHPDLAGALNNRAVCQLVAERLCCRAHDAAGAAAARRAATADLATAQRLQPDTPEISGNSGIVALRAADAALAAGRPGDAAPFRVAATAALQKALAEAPADWPHRALCGERLTAARAQAAR